MIGSSIAAGGVGRNGAFAGKVGAGLLVAGLALGAFGGSAAYANDKIVVALDPTSGGGLPILIGQAKGLFSAEGVDVETRPIPNPSTAVAAVASGDVDVASNGISAAFFNLAANQDLTLLAGTVYDIAGFANLTIIATKDAYAKGFHSATELPGKKIAIAGLGGFSQFSLYNLSQKYHFAYDSFTQVSLGSNPNVGAAVKAGSVDGGIVPAAVTVPLDKSGDGKIITWIGEEVPAMTSGLYTSRKTVANRRDAMVRFMKGYLKSAALYAASFEKHDDQGNFAHTAQSDELLDIIAKGTGIPRDQVSLQYIQPDGALDAASIGNEVAFYIKVGAVDPKVDATKLVDLSILNAAKGP